MKFLQQWSKRSTRYQFIPSMMKHYDVRVAVDKSKLCDWVSTWQGNEWSNRQVFNNLWQVFGQWDDLINWSPLVWVTSLFFWHIWHIHSLLPRMRLSEGLFFIHTFFTSNTGCCFLRLRVLVVQGNTVYVYFLKQYFCCFQSQQW